MKVSYFIIIFGTMFCLTGYQAYLHAKNPETLCPTFSTMSEVNSVINNNNNKKNSIVLYQDKWLVPLYDNNTTDESYPLFPPLKLFNSQELTVINSRSQHLDGEFCFYEIRFNPQPIVKGSRFYVIGRFSLKNELMPLTPLQNK